MLQVCANHLVQSGDTITYKDEEKKTLLWTALDFADDNGPNMDNVCCSFKTAETAAQFKDMYEESKGLSGKAFNQEKEKQPGAAINMSAWGGGGLGMSLLSSVPSHSGRRQ